MRRASVYGTPVQCSVVVVSNIESHRAFVHLSKTVRLAFIAISLFTPSNTMTYVCKHVLVVPSPIKEMNSAIQIDEY